MIILLAGLQVRQPASCSKIDGAIKSANFAT
jgi:hypothetical protein